MKTPQLKSYKTHGRFLGWGSGPDTDWKVMFSVFALLLALVAIVSVCVFFEVSDRGNEGPTSAEKSILDKQSLHSTALYYQKLRLDFEALRTATDTTPDPSI